MEVEFIVFFLLVAILIQDASTQGNFGVFFTKSPRSVSLDKNASFLFVFRDSNGRDPCAISSCSVLCKLDGGSSQNCASRNQSYVSLLDGKHVFEVSVNASSGQRTFAQYSWLIDTIPPTASLTTDRPFTNGVNVTVRILFSEPCNGSGGFSCDDASSCDMMLRGPGNVLPYTLKVVQPNLEYTLGISLSDTTTKGRIFLVLEKEICSDAAGNLFQRSPNSMLFVRFDRDPVFVNVWTPIVDSQVLVDNKARTIQATNKIDDLRIFLDFTDPVLNTTDQLSGSLHSSSGVFRNIRRKSRGNRRFAFLLSNVTKNGVVTVTFDSYRVISRGGTPIQPVTPVNFIFDQLRPKPAITTLTRAKTKDQSFTVLIQFPEPVFQFTSAQVFVSGGKVSNFKELSKSTYFAEVDIVSVEGMVGVRVPENQTVDIAGNLNMPSNVLQVRHYRVPSISEALYYFTTAGFLATTVASGALSISAASLAAAGALTSRTAGAIVTDPSRNMLGIVGHLQIFALSDWLSVNLPTNYRETIRGIRWIIPHAKVPWESQNRSLADTYSLGPVAPSMFKVKFQRRPIEMNIPEYAFNHDVIRRPERKLGSNSSVYGPPLSLTEYQRYFENQQRNSLEDFLRHKHTGWRDFERNMFWIGVVGGGLIILHVLTLQFLRWRTRTSLRGALTIPRFELFLFLVSLPSISQACSFIIRGGTVRGIVAGVLLLALPAAFLFCVSLFLAVGVCNGIVQYQQITLVNRNIPWGQKLLASLTGEKTLGRWVRRDGISSMFLPRYGLLFEDRKGPPKILVFDAEQDVLKWVESGANGIGRMKAINSDDEHELSTVSGLQRMLGAIRTMYIVVDIIRRLAIGVLMGAYSRDRRALSQIITALVLTCIQFVYLVVFKPYIRRGVQVVETISLACEAGIFAAAIAITSPVGNTGIGIFMLALFFISFIAQLVNQWYALMGLLLRLPPTQDPSLKLGLKLFVRGLLLPFVPRRSWSKFITPQAQPPKTGLAPVVHTTPSPDLQRHVGSPIAITETGVPYGRGSPSLADPRLAMATVRKQASLERGKPGVPKQTWSKWTRSWSLPTNSKSTELKMLRELAKASFSGVRKDDVEVEQRGERGKRKLGEEGISQQDEESDTSSSNGVVFVVPGEHSGSKTETQAAVVRQESFSSQRRSLEER